jgi:hypothetical protein
VNGGHQAAGDAEGVIENLTIGTKQFVVHEAFDTTW